MLINIDPILSPEILKTMREMGHGDRLVISDINFPAHSNHNRVHRLDGLDMATAWLDPLPPGPITKLFPKIVSPSTGIFFPKKTRSAT